MHTFLTGFGLYAGASLLIVYFAVNAYTGKFGLRAQQELDSDYAELSSQLQRLRAERVFWEERLKLLRSESIDPDMLDELVRDNLNYLHKNELMLIRPRP